MPEQATTYLLTQGILGLVCLTLVYVVIKLYNKTEKQETEKLDIIEARRLAELQTMKDVTEIIRQNTDNMRELSRKIEIGKSSGSDR